MNDEPNQTAGVPEPELQAPEPHELETKLAECERLRDEYLAGWQRAKADFVNYKKDEIGRLSEMGKYATEDMMLELIITLDNFDLAIATMEKAGTAEKGFYMIRAQLSDMLKRRGLEPIEAQVGAAFDPRTQEAIALADSEKPGGTVLEMIEVGYKLHDKVLRPVRVKVAKEKL